MVTERFGIEVFGIKVFGIEVIEIEIVEIDDGATEAIIKVGLANFHEIDGVVALELGF